MPKTFIIAEIGVNHNGSIALAKSLVDAALRSGADAVKFQSFDPDNLAIPTAEKAAYQTVSGHADESQADMLRRLQLSDQGELELKSYCTGKGIEFLSSAFDIDSLSRVRSLGVKLAKIPSGEIDNVPYLRVVASLGVPVLLSTGMSSLGDIEKALEVLVHAGLSTEDITLLHCSSAYPTPISEANLLAMRTLRDAFGVKVGYSDHTLGTLMPIAAVALGAVVIEKHLTMDRELPGPDHRSSLEPSEFKSMVASIRSVELGLGDGRKRCMDAERMNIRFVRKSIVASKTIKEGDTFTDGNLTTKRPGTGLSPFLWDQVLGKRARRKFRKDELIVL